MPKLIRYSEDDWKILNQIIQNRESDQWDLNQQNQ